MASTTAPAPTAAPKAAPPQSSKKLSDKTLKEKEFRWDKLAAWLGAVFLLAVIGGLWALSRFVLDTAEKGRSPGGDTVVGYTLGGITLILYGVVAAYSWRHKRRRQKRAMTRVWMEVHLAFGVVAGVSAVLHSGPKLGAPIHGAFLIAWLLLILTGVLGKLLSVMVPRRLTRIEDEALLVEDVVERQKAMRLEIEQLLQDADEKTLTLVNETIPAQIKSPDWYGARRMNRAAVVDSVYKAVDGDGLLAKGVLPADKKDWLRRIVTCEVEEVFLDRMLTYHYLLRAWVPVHVALTTLCFPWLIFHIVTVFLI
jgi:hypothetical protein